MRQSGQQPGSCRSACALLEKLSSGFRFHGRQCNRETSGGAGRAAPAKVAMCLWVSWQNRFEAAPRGQNAVGKFSPRLLILSAQQESDFPFRARSQAFDSCDRDPE